MPDTAVVVIGGDQPHPGVMARLPLDRTVYAADSGLDHADHLGLVVHRMIGDLDSVSDDALARHPDLPVDRYPTDKDATDTELAIEAAIADGHGHVTVVSGGGDRFDHLLSALTVLAQAARRVQVDAWIGAAHVHVLHDGDTLRAEPPIDALLSLVPLDGPAEGVRASGLRWPLDGERLDWGGSRGVSNEVTGPVSVSIERGLLAVILPQELGGSR